MMLKWLLGTALILTLSFGISGCVLSPKPKPGPSDTFCGIAEPWICRKPDTAETKERCRVWNLKLCRLCPTTPGCPAGNAITKRAAEEMLR
jgi:hypothetical protein